MHFELNEDVNPKQQINLSSECWRCIENDLLFFSYGNKLKLNGLLNLIVVNYWQDAQASISRRLDDAKREYEKTLGSMCSIAGANNKTVLDRLLDRKARELKGAIRNPQKGIGKKLRINKELYTILSEQCEEKDHYSSLGKYLHALYEEYAALPYNERERIVFKESINTVEEAIMLGKCIELRLGEKTHIIRPYKVINDSKTGYNYIVGIYSEGTACGETALFRVSRLSEIKKQIGSDGRISPMEADSLEEKIRECGTAYIISNVVEVKVLLSEEGEKTYAKKQTGRPDHIHKQHYNEQWTMYYFHCTEYQAKNYFLPFGEHAVVTAPESLAKEMADSYRKALKNYK